MEVVQEVGCREEMASHEGILGSLRPGDFKPHQYVNVGDKRLYRFVTAFNPRDITLGPIRPADTLYNVKPQKQEATERTSA